MNNVGVSTTEKVKTTPTFDERAGRTLWLAYFNNQALQEGLITREEHRRIQRKIAKIDIPKLS